MKKCIMFWLILGAATKNIWDAFLIICNLPYEDIDYISDDMTSGLNQLAEMSVISFIKVIDALKK